jgi:hypothetical protein
MDYFIPELSNNEDPCYTPRDYFDTQFSQLTPGANCIGGGINGGNNGSLYSLCSTLPSTLPAMLSELSSKNQQLQAHVQRPCIETVVPDLTHAQLEVCIRKLIAAISQTYLGQHQYQTLITLLSQQLYFDMRAQALSVYYLQGDFTGARNYMQSSLNPCTQEHHDFIAVQQINADYMEQGHTSYEPTVAELNIVHAIALKIDPLSAYAAGLYYALTGQWIPVVYPTIPQINQPIPRNTVSNPVNQEVKLYPNPTSDNLNVEVNGYKESSLIIELYDLSGRLLQKERVIEGVNSINVTNLDSGVYMARISQEDKHIESQRIMIVK